MAAPAPTANKHSAAPILPAPPVKVAEGPVAELVIPPAPVARLVVTLSLLNPVAVLKLVVVTGGVPSENP